MEARVTVPLSGERFSVVYRLCAPSATEANARARSICVEQTVEFPADLLPEGDIPGQVVGRIEALERLGPDTFSCRLSYAVETAGIELPQLLNVCFGNISLQPGIRLERLELPDGLLSAVRGPRFGRRGLRELLGAPERPLLCSAVKPMGLSATALAELAHDLALGGMDLIKDDHGLADQPFCPFEERVARCAEQVGRANALTGGRCLYAPNVTTTADRVQERARWAVRAGAGALLVSPGLLGFDVMRTLADDDAVGVPLLCHPALLGSFVAHPSHGMSHRALFGQLPRLFGADAMIFPHAAGRFAFDERECRDLADGTTTAMAHIAPSFPVPAGGMRLDRVEEICYFYGTDVMLLIGGDLHRGPDLVERTRQFRELVEAWAEA